VGRRVAGDGGGGVIVAGIPQRLTTRRKATGVTRKQIAAEVGVEVRSLSAWERGERSPTLKHAVKWARALGAEIEMTGA
jgi:transcriptional regulator with XRE-family HTH domain